MKGKVIIINIEIKNNSRLKELLFKIYSKIEDMLFSIIQAMPVSFIPRFLMRLTEHYINKRISDLNRQLIRDRWRSIGLEKVVDDIRKQDTKRAPLEG